MVPGRMMAVPVMLAGVVQQHGDDVGAGERKVGIGVAVEIARGDRLAVAVVGEVAVERKRPTGSAEQHRRAAGEAADLRDVQVAVSVEVREGDRLGLVTDGAVVGARPERRSSAANKHGN